jgi:hypothetical protein
MDSGYENYPQCAEYGHAAEDRFALTPRTRKHRYVWFANPADRALLKWEVLPYPKPIQENNGHHN